MKTNKEKQLLSIIIPLYNVEQFISDCLLSVCRQTYAGGIECIIVDDCGNDNSVAIVEDFIARYTGPIQFRLLHHTHNQGLSAARNTGMDNAKGEFLYFLDSDDWLDDDTLQVLYDEIATDDQYIMAIGYYTATYEGQNSVFRPNWIFDAPRDIESKDFAYQMMSESSNHASTAKLYRRKYIDSVRFRLGKRNEDTLFDLDLIPIVETKQLKCRDIPNYGYHYVYNDSGISASTAAPLAFAVLENIDECIMECANNPKVVECLKYKKISNIAGLAKNHRLPLKIHLQAARMLRGFSLAELKQGRKKKTFMHYVLYAYLPRVSHIFKL